LTDYKYVSTTMSKKFKATVKHKRAQTALVVRPECGSS
jgi:hypothetical protein